jgi:hypothetical protein
MAILPTQKSARRLKAAGAMRRDHFANNRSAKHSQANAAPGMCNTVQAFATSIVRDCKYSRHGHGGGPIDSNNDLSRSEISRV